MHECENYDLADMQANMNGTGEALRLIRDLLGELIDASGRDRADYQTDLNRLSVLASHMV